MPERHEAPRLREFRTSFPTEEGAVAFVHEFWGYISPDDVGPRVKRRTSAAALTGFTHGETSIINGKDYNPETEKYGQYEVCICRNSGGPLSEKAEAFFKSKRLIWL